MKSTGEVMGLDSNFANAFLKSQLGAGLTLPDSGSVFVSVREADRTAVAPLVSTLIGMGFKIIATTGTARDFSQMGHDVEVVNKVREGRPHIVDAMKSGSVQLVINTTEGAKAIADSFSLRRAALIGNIPYYTTVAGATAAVQAITAQRSGQLEVAPLQSYFKGSF
jgi:carbamoyl-phosphate synthase large subunit